MALRIVFDNQAEQLLDQALQLIGHPPGGAPMPDVFASDALVVPGLGVGRWIQQRAADRFGVSAFGSSVGCSRFDSDHFE